LLGLLVTYTQSRGRNVRWAIALAGAAGLVFMFGMGGLVVTACSLS
jgi:hypothetical protein